MSIKKLALPLCLLALTACEPDNPADRNMAESQRVSLAEAQAQVGMPAIVNWQEKRMAKDIYEMRDRSIATHTYIMNEIKGCLIYLGPSIGFGLPYATQYSAPTTEYYAGNSTRGQKPQAEPNGLFMPASADGTWVLLKDPASTSVEPVYVEPRIVISPFRLSAQECR
jgi:hypothetical protein